MFGPVDERDTRIENVVETFRVALWWGDPDDEEDLTTVEVLESTTATLDETLDWARRAQAQNPRLVEIFAVRASARKAGSSRPTAVTVPAATVPLLWM